jgi:hypothetical protein
MAALALDDYNAELNTTFPDDSIDIRLKKIDITLTNLTEFYNANVKNKHSNASKAELRKIKSSILKIRKGRKDMIDANNLIIKTLGLPVVTSALKNQPNYSPLDDPSPNNPTPTSPRRSMRSVITGKLLPFGSRKSNSKKTGTKKGGSNNTKTQKKKRI